MCDSAFLYEPQSYFQTPTVSLLSFDLADLLAGTVRSLGGSEEQAESVECGFLSECYGDEAQNRD